MVLREFIRTMYHEVEIHESGALLLFRLTGMEPLITHEGRGLLPGMRELVGETAKALDALYDVDPIPDSSSSSHSRSLMFRIQASGKE